MLSRSKPINFFGLMNICKVCEYEEIDEGLTSCEECNYEIRTDPDFREKVLERFPEWREYLEE